MCESIDNHFKICSMNAHYVSNVKKAYEDYFVNSTFGSFFRYFSTIDKRKNSTLVLVRVDPQQKGVSRGERSEVNTSMKIEN